MRLLAGRWRRWDARYRAARQRFESGAVEDLRPGVMVAQKESGATAVELWVGAVLDRDGSEITATVTVAPEPAGGPPAFRGTVTLHWFAIAEHERQVTGWDARRRFFHAHLDVADLAADTWHTVTVEVGGHEARCRARTLPAGLGAAPLRVFTASCYDVDTDREHGMHASVAALAGEGRRPDLAWFTGDAVYADAPWWFYAAGRHTPRSYLLMEYWAAWGMQAGREGLRELLVNGPNWFLPDDHEFWNNWPHHTVTAKHSYQNIGKALRNGVGRRFALLRATTDQPAPAEPGPPPQAWRWRARTLDGHRRQNYHPVHPDEWDTWSRGAFDLFGSFQTPSVRDRRARRDPRDPDHPHGRITRGARDDDATTDPGRTPRDGPRGTLHQPVNQLLQTIEIDPLTVVLLDTRTRRTRQRMHPGLSRFVDPEVLDELVEHARAAPVLVVVLAQPVLVAPQGPLGQRLPSMDRGMHHYPDQYRRFWTELMAARAGRPTVTIGGDIHRSYVALAPSLSLLEVVASPMSFVTSPWLLGLGERLTHPARELAAGSVVLDDVARLARDGGLAPGPAVSHGCLAADQAGFALLELTRTGDGPVELAVELRPRHARPGDDPGPGPSATFHLHLDGRAGGSVERV
ncbi:MAG: hypothetical protein ACT4RN_16630 [Pseudonocardia sp.]